MWGTSSHAGKVGVDVLISVLSLSAKLARVLFLKSIISSLS